MQDFWQFNIGNLLTIFTLLGSVLAAFFTLRGRVDGLNERMLFVENKLEQLVTVLVEQGRHQERLIAFDNRLNLQGQRIDKVGESLNALLAMLAQQSPKIAPDHKPNPREG